MRRRQQHPHQPDGRFDRGTDDKRSCHSGEALCEIRRLLFDGRCAADEFSELVDGVAKREQMRCEWGDGGSRHRPPFPQIGDDLVDQPDRLGGIVQHHLGDDAAVATRKLLAQPCLDDLDESEVGLGFSGRRGRRHEILGGDGLDFGFVNGFGNGFVIGFVRELGSELFQAFELLDSPAVKSFRLCLIANEELPGFGLPDGALEAHGKA